jgi:cytochrome P450
MKSNPFAAIPMAPGANLFGHIHQLQHNRLNFLRQLGSVAPLTRTMILHRPVLFACSPEVVHELLVEKAASLEKSPGIRLLLRDLGGDGLFTSEGDLWKRQRRLMSPLFQPSQLSTYAGTMNREARRALDRLADGAQVDLLREATRITMAVVGATLFGSDTFNQTEELGDALTVLLAWVNDQAVSNRMTLQVTLIEAVEYFRARTSGRLAALFQRAWERLREPFLFIGRHTPEWERAMHTIDDSVHHMIRERRAHPTARRDLLTRLLLARDGEVGGSAQGMSDQQLRDEVNTLFIAGHETTATALAWAFYELARNPTARARVQAEADALGPEGPSQPEPQGLEYTTRVFKEVLRLYPPLVLLARRAREPVEIAGIHLPKNTLLFISPYTLHHQPELWPDPDRFDPDRYLPAQEAARPKGAWVPFGLGPRVCIGNHFALLEGPIVLTTLMRQARFEIDASRVIEPDDFATLRPRGGVPAIVHRHRHRRDPTGPARAAAP